MADGAGDDDKAVREAKALPLPERLAHSHWRVRADAYADVGTEASSAADTSSASLSEFGAPGGARRALSPAV
jgi:cytoskeleton-associated protein 5